MEAEHHHDANMGLGVKGCNHPLPYCDLSARKRPNWTINATLSQRSPQMDRATIATCRLPSYIESYDSNDRSFQISIAEPLPSPGGLGASAPANLPGASLHF